MFWRAAASKPVRQAQPSGRACRHCVTGGCRATAA